jgi:hypothetical protein
MTDSHSATWVQCPLCEDWWCQLHNEHVYECDCPPLEDLLPADPYDDPPEVILREILKKDPV